MNHFCIVEIGLIFFVKAFTTELKNFLVNKRIFFKEKSIIKLKKGGKNHG
jgi:hypothetical protein